MFTIITPTYNRAYLIEATINSIICQSCTDWELIIVDDGSTDNTEEVIGKYLSDARIKYVKKNNSGQADSLNVGVTYASGNFLTFLDSDDEAYPDWLEVVRKNIKENTGIACASAVRKLQDGTLIHEKLSETKLFGKKMKVKFTCGSLFIKRNVFTEVGGYDSSLQSNIQTDLGYRLIAYVVKNDLDIVSIDECLVQVNVHNGPRIRTNWGKLKTGSIQFFNKHYDFFRTYDPNGLASVCGVIAYSSYKLKDRSDAILYIMKAIKHNPLRLRNYVRMLRYACL